MIQKLLNLKTLDELPPLNLKWILDSLIREQTITQFFGRGGVGKTTLSLSIAKYALDRKLIDQVFYIDCDNSTASLCDNNIITFVSQYKNRFHYYADYSPNRFQNDFLSQNNLKGVLLIIDGTINFIEGSKLNNDESANKFMQILKELRRRCLTIIFQNHVAKHDNSTSKGNNQLENYSDENIKVERVGSIYSLSPKKYRIPNLKPLTIEVDRDTFDIKKIFCSDVIFNLTDEEKMTLKLCVEILNGKECGLNQKTLTKNLYELRDERHLEIVGRNRLWTLLKKLNSKLFQVKHGDETNEKIYTLSISKEAANIKKSILEMDDL